MFGACYFHMWEGDEVTARRNFHGLLYIQVLVAKFRTFSNIPVYEPACPDSGL